MTGQVELQLSTQQK